ncbi:MAG: cytochrome c biogenesis protein CcsA [Desulfovibrio sp.]|jgi:cytochrome c-type biogenesis protein CcmF|nr:cytochrome c biogenesis protein CcsA [Desulfovibrio sp.]
MIIYNFAAAVLYCGFFLALGAAFVQLAGLFSPAAPDAEHCGPPRRDLSPARLGAPCILALAGLLTLDALILFHAFAAQDFIVEYVAGYSDSTLPAAYRVTAFWAGQPGSLLFWAWAVSLSGALFVLLPTYKKLCVRTQAGFCLFFTGITAFFLLILAEWNNPFALLDFVPEDGRGLNPLLQNPGMVLHPPLLFLGYGGFVVPGCLALAQSAGAGKAGEPEIREAYWGDTARPFILAAWALLTAGIVLGAWWAYMELGWGGYWAWDPVENASLLPWLISSAYLHTSVIGRKRGKLRRTNVFLMCLTTVSAFFAAYLVRSGVVQSLHAFSDEGVGLPLLVFTLVFLYLAGAAALCTESKDTRPLEDLSSKEGLLLFVAWLLSAVAAVILIATLWPVIIDALIALSAHLPAFVAGRLPQTPMGLEASFYNRACLPLLALPALLLLVCPGRKWKLSPGASGFTRPRLFYAVLAAAAGLGTTLSFAGIQQPVALAAAACAAAGTAGILLHLFTGPRPASLPAAHGAHVGLLLMTLGVALSGPYQQKYTLTLGRGETGKAGQYRVTVRELYEGESRIGADGRPGYRFVEAELRIAADDGTPLGTLSPQRRRYAKFEQQSFAEAVTLFGPGNELYAVLLGIDEMKASLSFNVNPLVNWIWFGGILMCVFPVAGLVMKRAAGRPAGRGAPGGAREGGMGLKAGVSNHQGSCDEDDTGEAEETRETTVRT